MQSFSSSSGGLASVAGIPTYAINSFSSDEDATEAEPVSPTGTPAPTVDTDEQDNILFDTTLRSKLMSDLCRIMTKETADLFIDQLKPEGLPQLVRNLEVDKAGKCVQPEFAAAAAASSAATEGTTCKITCHKSTQSDSTPGNNGDISKQGSIKDPQSAAAVVHSKPPQAEDAEADEGLEALVQFALARKAQTSNQTMKLRPDNIPCMAPYDRAVTAWERATSQAPWRSVIEAHPKNQDKGQWNMFRRTSKDTHLTLDLHSWTGGCQSACEILRPCEAAAATEAYIYVVQQTLRPALRGDPVHIITGKGDGVQFKAVKHCLVALRMKRVIKDYHAVNAGGGYHGFL